MRTNRTAAVLCVTAMVMTMQLLGMSAAAAAGDDDICLYGNVAGTITGYRTFGPGCFIYGPAVFCEKPHVGFSTYFDLYLTACVPAP